MHINPSHGAHDTLSRPESVHLIQEKASIRTRVLAARHKIHSSFIDIFCVFLAHVYWKGGIRHDSGYGNYYRGITEGIDIKILAWDYYKVIKDGRAHRLNIFPYFLITSIGYEEGVITYSGTLQKSYEKDIN